MRPIRGPFASGFTGLLLVSLSPPADALVIDDFEQGPFSFTTASHQVGTQATTAGVHCIGSFRQVTLVSGLGNTVFAQLIPSLAVPDDEVQSVFTDGGGSLEFLYQMPATDVTSAGTEGRLDVEVTTVDPFNFQIELALEDGGGTTETKTQGVYGPGLQSFFFSDFPGVDVTHLVGIRVRLWTSNAGDLHVSDIRTRKASAAAVGWEVENAGPVDVPPYPGAGIAFTGGPRPHLLPSDPISPIEGVAVSLDGVSMLGITADFGLSAEGNASTTVGGTAQTSVSWIGEGTYPTDFVLDVLTTMEPVAGINPCCHDPLVTSLAPTAFRVEFDVDQEQGADLLGTTHHSVLYEIGDQPLEFTGPSVSTVDPTATNFHTLFHVRVNGGVIDPAAALFGIEVVADIWDGWGGLTGVDDEPAVRPRLTAHPVIMRGTTHLRVEGVGPGAVDLTVHDVAGRLVTRLHAVPGQDVLWRGTTRWGTSVPAGVYLVRAEGKSRSPAIRLVKLR
jgi:hypothetical protein